MWHRRLVHWSTRLSERPSLRSATTGISLICRRPPSLAIEPAGPISGPAWRIRHDQARRALLVPAGIAIDLGATAKALVVDRAAGLIARQAGCGVLVGVGGDIAVAGEHPPGGWRIAIGEHHRSAERDRDDLVAITTGGLATSSTVARSWKTATRIAHHIVDPRTGGNPEPCWRTVSAVAGNCLDANAAATAAIVLGAAAPGWLRRRGIPARMVLTDGSVHHVAGWPEHSWEVGR
jgi:thiamine biosynthesis lipoprotein